MDFFALSPAELPVVLLVVAALTVSFVPPVQSGEGQRARDQTARDSRLGHSDAEALEIGAASLEDRSVADEESARAPDDAEVRAIQKRLRHAVDEQSGANGVDLDMRICKK